MLRILRHASSKAGKPAARAELASLGSAPIRAIWEQDSADAYVVGARFLKTPKTVSIVGAPMSWGQPQPGTDMGPELVRTAGLGKALKRLGWRIHSDSDLSVDAPTSEDERANEKYMKATGELAHNASSVGKFLHKLATATEQSASRDEFVLTIGGDHSIGCGSVAGILKARPDTGVIWVDAHGDLQTPQTTETGNMHGMPVGLLMLSVEERTKIPGFAWMNDDYPVLDPSRIVFVGARDLDQAERRIIKHKQIKCFTMTDVDRWGIGVVMDLAIKHLGASCPLHLSYDVDAVDAQFAPHTGTVVRGGFSYREANYITESIAETNRLCSMDLVEINPKLGPITSPLENETVQLGLALIASAMGQRLL